VPALAQVFYRSAGTIVWAAPARKTGLVPEGWSVKRDEPEGLVYLNRLDFLTGPVLGDTQSVSGQAMIQLGRHAYGSLGLVFELQVAQEAGRDIIPIELRRYYFLAPRTVVEDVEGHLFIAGLSWLQTDNYENGRWVSVWLPIDDAFYPEARFIRPRQ